MGKSTQFTTSLVPTTEPDGTVEGLTLQSLPGLVQLLQPSAAGMWNGMLVLIACAIFVWSMLC